VKKKILELKEDVPGDVVLEEVLFQPENVSKSVNDFSINLLEGIVFVIIVVFIGMGLKNAIIVST